MTETARRRALAALLLAVAALALLAIALPRLELKPGVPMPGGTSAPGRIPLEDDERVSIAADTYLTAIVEVIAVLLAALCGYKLFKGVPWRALLGPAVLIAVLGTAVLYILFTLLGVQVSDEPNAPETLPPELSVAGPALGPVPAILIGLVCAGLALAVVLLGLWLGRRRDNPPPVDPLALEAELAVQALKAGADYKNVVVRCYRQMSLALRKEQGIEREGSMTAREFEQLLEARGIPAGPVSRLTALFEVARYGTRPPEPGEEQQAIDCLNAIAQYSRENQPASRASQ